MTNKLPPCFAFKNTGKHPRKDEIKKRFNEISGEDCNVSIIDSYYGRESFDEYNFWRQISRFGSTVVEITEDDFLAMTEPELTELPKVFAFHVDHNSPNRDLLEKRFIWCLGKFQWLNPLWGKYYGRSEDGGMGCYPELKYFGKDVVEITEQQFLDLTEPKPELTKLPDNFYFQYVDEKDREVLKERFGKITSKFWTFKGIDWYYGIIKGEAICYCHKDRFSNSTEITQQDFIRLTEPATTYKGDIKDFPKEVVEWMLDNQVKQGNKRDISVFEKSRFANKINGGFNWDLVGDYFCTDVIVSKNFNLFFKKYPKYTSPEQSTLTGQIIEISERGILIELTKDQIKEFKIFETVTIK